MRIVFMLAVGVTITLSSCDSAEDGLAGLNEARDWSGTWVGAITFTDNAEANHPCTWEGRSKTPAVRLVLIQSGTSMSGSVHIDIPGQYAVDHFPNDGFDCLSLDLIGSSPILNGSVSSTGITFRDRFNVDVPGNTWVLTGTTDLLSIQSVRNDDAPLGLGLQATGPFPLARQ